MENKNQEKKRKQGRNGNLQVGGPGRPKGVKNKMGVQLKEMILNALDKSGGVEYLARQAEENPSAFMALVGKVLPLTVAGDPDGAPVKIEVSWIK